MAGGDGNGNGYEPWGVSGGSAGTPGPAVPDRSTADGRPMTSFPPAETGFFPPSQPGEPQRPMTSAAGFQAPPMPEPEPQLLLGPPPGLGGPGNSPDKRRRALLIGASAIAVVGVTAGAIAFASSGGDSGSKQPAAASSPGGLPTTSGTSSGPAPVDNNSAPGSPAGRDGQNVPGGPASGTGVPPAAGSKPSSSPGSKPSTPGQSTSTGPAAPAGSAPKTTAPALPVAAADLLHWRLAEAAGTTAADTSGRNLAGTASGAATFDPTQHGGSVFFHGPANQIKGGEVATKGAAIDTTKSFTISMWINQTGLTTPTKYAAAFSQDGTQNFAFTFSYSLEAKTWSFVRADTDSPTPTSIGVGAKTPVPLNSWHQLTGVYDAPGGTIAFYVDGVPQGTAKAGSAPYAAAGPFAIGRSWYQKYPSNPFNGYISDVRIYSRALSAAEVKAL
ncbi:MAG: hypothetical protein HOV87_36380 [Catenulispora sp.]|nr:hypothetical protein [Catenulispora sp.]